MAHGHNIALDRAASRKSFLVDVGLIALSSGDWRLVQLISFMVQYGGMSHA